MSLNTDKLNGLPMSPFDPANGSAASVWQCKCGWVVDEARYLSIVFNAPCPRCKSKYSTFHRRQVLLSPNAQIGESQQMPNDKLTHGGPTQ